MLLNAELRKIMTIALVLPIGVTATSSYADCRSAEARADEKASRYEFVVYDSLRSQDAGEREPSAVGGRLSRTAFYGDEPAIAISEL